MSRPVERPDGAMRRNAAWERPVAGNPFRRGTRRECPGASDFRRSPASRSAASRTHGRGRVYPTPSRRITASGVDPLQLPIQTAGGDSLAGTPPAAAGRARTRGNASPLGRGIRSSLVRRICEPGLPPLHQGHDRIRGTIPRILDWKRLVSGLDAAGAAADANRAWSGCRPGREAGGPGFAVETGF